jgi:hypothetical protein
LSRRAVRLALLAVAAAAVSGQALAAERMISFDPDSDEARRLTGRGVTVVFSSILTRQRVTKILATAVPASAELRPVSRGVLGGLDVEGLGALYAIDPRAGQGAAYVRAFCPGSTKAWLSFSRISRYPLSIKAFGDDPAAPGKARACADMTFRFRGEWALPGRGPPDPMEETRDLGPF